MIPIWTELETILQNVHPAYVDNYERVFGMVGNTPNIILRNWLRFLLRHCIVQQENIAYHNKRGKLNVIDIKLAYNKMVKREVWLKYNIFKNLGQLDKFQSIFAINDYLIAWQDDQWQIITPFKLK